jgi:serine/threonine-protein kinase
MAGPSELVGQTLGHYRIQELIGAGGMGFVYRAHDNRLDRDVAVKVLPPGTLHSENARRRFRREALALARLNHPNIAVVHDFDTQAGTDFLVMEFVTGLSLADKLAVTRPLPEKQIFSIGHQIASALDCAHTAGVVHRDLKPGNIMLTPNGGVKLLDFGLSMLLSSAEEDQTQVDTVTAAQRVTGTLPYMAPEQLRGQTLDGRCDIYALGVVLYEMATGHPPFEAKASGAMIDEILHARPAQPQSRNPEISVGLSEIILKCIEKDPEDRYRSARELIVETQRTATASAPVQRVTGTTRAVQRALRQNRGLLITVTAVALLVLGAFVMGRWHGERPGAAAGGALPLAQVRSIAVLPLENLSGDPKQDYFADGMTEELIGALTKISSLHVISRTSAMQYKGVHKPLPQIARELHVDAVVEGSVTRHEKNGRVRVTAQLIDASTDRSMWSESYERDLGDVFALQDEVARNIATEIRAQLTPVDQQRLASARPVKSEAHEAYLKGRYYWNKGTDADGLEARKYFEQAIRLDSNYAAAYSGLADYYWNTDQLTPRDAVPQAKQYVLKALALDDDLVDAHTTLGSIKFYGDWDWSGADGEFRRAIELGPSNAEAHRMYAVYLAEMGRGGEAQQESQTARTLNPVSPIAVVTSGWAFYYARNYDGAIQQCREALKLDPNYVPAHDCLSSALIGQQAYEGAISEAQVIASAATGDPLRRATLGRAFAAAGKKEEARRVLVELAAASRTHYVPPYFFCIIHAALGEKDEALTWLERAYRGRDSYLARIKVDDAYDPLRGDPRFEAVVRKMGLPP